MPTPGYVFRDGQPIPDAELEKVGAKSQQYSSLGEQKDVTTDVAQIDTQAKIASINAHAKIADGANPSSIPSRLVPPTTDSHALAAADHDIKGVAQLDHDASNVKDTGWKQNAVGVPTLVGKLPNEELWTLVRRFNKQMYHVKTLREPPIGGLDLNIADEDEFSPDKLRSNLERLYMTVIIGLMGFGKHIVRLRSWREPRRTAAFAAVYFLAWLLNFLVPTLVTTMIVLITVPRARTILFPPAPLALVDSKTGGAQKPSAGVLGSHDSATGAPEKHQGEAVEQEASNLVHGITSVAISSAAGKHDQSAPEHDSFGSKVPDPTNLATSAADAKDAAQGGDPSQKHDKTKEPMEQAIWVKARPVMHTLGDVADGWERFANALSPTAPFPETPRLKLAAILGAPLLVSLFVTSSMFMKGTTFIVGSAFFSDPLMQRGIKLLNEKIPDWPKYLEIRNTILKGVPTNAQLTITLLRVGEANRAPLPPPPRSDEPPPDKAAHLDKSELQLDATHADVEDAIHPDLNAQPASPTSSDTPKKKKRGSRIVSFFKGTTYAGVETKLGADNLRAAIGSTKAKEHLGILETGKTEITGPVEFKGRHKGKKGSIYINSTTSPATATTSASPCVYFATERDGDAEAIQKSIFSIPIADIRELKKVGGLGWKGKLIVGWATDKEVADGLEIVDKNGETYRITAIRLRDELFNRLVAMGGQVWESY